MSIQLVTYANQTVTPTNDAIIYERAIDQNGIFYGCNVTVSSNNVNITGGYGIVCGREFVIQSESIAVTLAPSGTLLGRLYVRLDLADADAPIQLLTATGNTLPALEQDADVNYTNGVWEMELATFDVGVSALSDVVETYETIQGNKTMLDAVQPIFVSATKSGYTSTSANTLQYTGANVTIPKKSIYVIMARITFSNAKPNAVTLNTTSTGVNDQVASGLYSGVIASCTYVNKTDNNPLTLYAWANYNTATSSAGSVYITGFYIPCE